MNVKENPVRIIVLEVLQRNWLVISANIISSLFEAISEGATLGIVFLMINSLSTSSKPQNLSAFFDNSILPRELGELYAELSWMNTIKLLLAFAVASQLLQSLAKYVTTLTVGLLSSSCRMQVIQKIDEQILSMSLSNISKYRVGDLLLHTTDGPLAIKVLVDAVSSIFVSVLLLMTYVYVLFKLSWQLVAASIAVLVIITTVQRFLLPKIDKGGHDVLDKELSLSTALAQDVQSIRLIHTMGINAYCKQNIAFQTEALLKSLNRQIARTAFISPFAQVLPILLLCTVLLLFIGFDPSSLQSSTLIASLSTFILALQRLNSRVVSIASSSNYLAGTSAQLKRLGDFLRTSDKELIRTGGISAKLDHVAISMQSVSLKYENTTRNALSNINLDIPSGSKIALVGSSGAGKSSIVDLIVGLYKPSSGEILINGQPNRVYDIQSWQTQIGVVSQDTVIMNASIKENIAMGVNYSQDDLNEAIKLASCEAFINTLPHGLHTIVGERGYTLSGGQRQRIALARAFIKKPPLLILDEATSSLDIHTENIIQKAVDQINCTVIMVAHRLSTVSECDMIVVLENGAIVEMGAVQSLLSSNTIFKGFWDKQMHANQ